MSNEEAQRTRLLLYVFCASDARCGELNHTYAHSETEARAALLGWMTEQSLLGRKNIEVKHWPGGFVAGYRAYWPGSIPAQSGESEVKP